MGFFGSATTPTSCSLSSSSVRLASGLFGALNPLQTSDRNRSKQSESNKKSRVYSRTGRVENALKNVWPIKKRSPKQTEILFKKEKKNEKSLALSLSLLFCISLFSCLYHNLLQNNVEEQTKSKCSLTRTTKRKQKQKKKQKKEKKSKVTGATNDSESDETAFVLLVLSFRF